MQHPLPGEVIASLVVVVGVAAATRGAVAPVIGVTMLSALVAVWRDPYPWRVVMVVGLLALVAAVRADRVWDGAQPRGLGPFEGWAAVVGDPQPLGGATRVVLEVEGERFELWARGRAARTRVAGWADGQEILVSLERERLAAERAGRVVWQHVVGGADLVWVADVRDGAPVDRASNRVREVLARGAATLPPDDAALFRGLVVGDDRDQPPQMIARFRASGLSHLTAVSGQNVAFVLAAVGPFLRRLRPVARWVATVGVIGWFVALTRFEPSIMRAGAMAALSATAFALGRERGPARLLGVAVVGLLVVDPLLVRSVGFWLSAGATAGVTMVGPWLSSRLRVLGSLATPVGITLGAQAGVVVPAALVFGRLPLMSVPANLLAVPVAGAVMLYGLPAGLLAGAVPPLAPVVMFPCRLGVRWVDTVAALGARLEPTGAAWWIGWGAVIAAVVALATAPRRTN